MTKNLSTPIRWSLLGSVLAGFVLTIPTVNAYISKSYGAQDNSQRVSSAVSEISQALQQRTRSNTDLPSKRYSLVSDAQENEYVLGPLDLKMVKKTAPNQIGIGRAVGISSQGYGRLFLNQDGSKVRVLAIKSPDAIGMRLHFERFDIPAGDEVYVYGLSMDSHVSGPYVRYGPFGTEKGPSGVGEFWTDTIEGDTIIIEHYMNDRETGLYISEISHLFKDIPSENEAIPEVLACHNDAMCFSDVSRDAVGRITFVEGASTFVCTGTLMNNITVDFAPYFHTANHCVSTQTVARTVEIYWFYRTTFCNSGVVSGSWVHTPSGTNLLATVQTADSSFLRILNTLPEGLRYTGWDANLQPLFTSVFGISHPGPGTPPSTQSYLRRASGFIASTATNCPDTGLLNGYVADWTSGLTEPGSSGSGLFYASGGDNFLVGVLSCGPVPSSCADLSLYGKFSDFFPTVQTYMSQGDSGGSCAASPISIGQTINGSLAGTDCKSRVRGVSYLADRYSFSGTAGQQIFIFLSSAGFDTYLYLVAPNKSLAAEDDDGGGGTNSRIPFGSGLFSLPSSGLYTIEVTSFFQNTTGNYTLSLNGSGGSPGGTQTIGLYRPPSTFYLRNSNTTGFPDISVPFGALGDIPVVGDWNGDGVTTIGLYRPSNSTFYLRNSNTIGFPDITVSFGNGPGGDVPIVGDWDGNGTWTIGVYRPSISTFYLRNSNTVGFPDLSIPFGAAGDTPVVGDWDGNGTMTIGLYRASGSIFYLRNNNTTGFPDMSIPYGAAGDLPIVGDWDGNGTVTIGLYRPSGSIFFLRNSNTTGFPDLSIPFGASGDKPLGGNWDGQ